MAYKTIEIRKDGPVDWVTLNRPDRLNALNPQLVDELLDYFQNMYFERKTRVIVMKGAGRAFCAGLDLKERETPDNEPGGGPQRGLLTQRRISEIVMRMRRCQQPIISLVHGPACGGGFAMALASDIRIAGESARFAESFVKLGIIPGDGGAWLLPRAVGYSKACEMAFTGDIIDAKEALACGLVSKVVPNDELIPAAMDLARRIAANPGHALRLTKRLMKEGQHMRLDSLLQLSAAMQALAHATEEHRAAVAAFMAKTSKKGS